MAHGYIVHGLRKATKRVRNGDEKRKQLERKQRPVHLLLLLLWSTTL